MSKHLSTCNYNAPEAYITKGKNRLKQIGNTVYLKNNEEFELEFFNPKSNSILAKIKINNKPISFSGLIIRPGERVYLDRYIDDARKFLFSTYEVEGDNEAVKKAIMNNGLVSIDFFDEIIATPKPLYLDYTYPNQNYGNWYNKKYTRPGIYPIEFDGCSAQPMGELYNFTTNDGIYNDGHTTISASLNPTYESKLSYSRSSVSEPQKFKKRSMCKESLVETGRIEMGESSNTKLESVDMNFSYQPIKSIVWQILPESQRPIEISDLKTYCPNCGIRIKKSTWVYCSKCGCKL